MLRLLTWTAVVISCLWANAAAADPSCNQSQSDYLEVDPISPETAHEFTVSISPHAPQGWDWYSLSTAVRGNRIDVTLSMSASGFDGAPIPPCLTQVVGPLAEGTYTVNLKTLDGNSEDPPTFREAMSFAVGGNSVVSCDPGGAGYIAVTPSQPNDLQPVSIIVGREQAILTSARIRASGSTFNVTLSGTVNDFSVAIPNHCLSLDFGALPVGIYEVNLSFADSASSSGAPAPIANRAFSVTNGPPGAMTGLWWNSAQPGWGISLVQHGGIVFAAWYSYDTTGSPRWYVVPRCALHDEASGQGCTGRAYVVQGPIPLVGTPQVVTFVGYLDLDFQDSSNGSMSYTVLFPGGLSPILSGASSIARESLRVGPAPTVDFSDLWWNPSDPGWGVAITQQSNVMFLALFVHDSAGNPVWYVAPDCEVASSAQSCTGALYRTRGPALGTYFDPSKVEVTPVGTATATFSDANNGSISYTVGSIVPTIRTITRQLF